VIVRFGSCELDLDRIVLRRDGLEVKLEPQAFDVLAFLVQRRGSVVRKEELLDQIWGDRFVSESALTTRIKAVRHAVADDGQRQAIIRTVHGKGYEFVAAVEIVAPGEPESAATSTGPAATAAVAIPGLGASVEPLIGRDTILALLDDALARHRLITLVGPGGVGKTSLGLELARTTAERYADGVHVVELVSVVDAEATAAAFATAIDVSVRRDSSIDDAIIDLLRPRNALLLLDNCEHLVEPVAALVARILREAPHVSIVATSREPLAVAGEQVWSVEPLSTASDSDATSEQALSVPAVELFVTRARAADPTFVLDDVTAPIVVEICRRLDGIPLAIELAAARARAVGVADIAQRLDERFALLKAMRRGSDPRHRTMLDTISWSYDLLERDEQELFTTLSVFAGSFDLRAAEAISGRVDALDLLTRLAERSMLAVRHQRGGANRYELLETLRDYGRARLADDRAAQLFAAHAGHFADDAVAVEREMQGPDEPRAIARAESSFADLRAAQRFALETGALDDAFQLIASIREFAMRALRYEVFAWADAACRVPGALEHPLAPMLTGVRAYGAWIRGEFELAIALAEETERLEHALRTAPNGLAQRTIANVQGTTGHAALGREAATRQIEQAEAAGIDSRIVHACYMGAVAFSADGKYDAANEFVARARECAARTGAPTDRASVAVATGFASRSESRALEAFVEAHEIARAAGNRWMSAFALTEASGLVIARGELARGCAALVDIMSVWYRAGEWAQQWHTLSRCVIALARLGNDELAVELVGSIEAHAQLGVAPMSAVLQDALSETRHAVLGRVGDQRAAELRERGAASSVDDIVMRTQRALVAAT
jgi:predicted ATPase/DNA-binding winged helix-turn-helix (wHTH) protein